MSSQIRARINEAPPRAAPAIQAADSRSRALLGTGRALLTLTRPGQWIKNLLVLAAPAAAGVLDEPPVLARTVILLIACICASAAVYAVNDIRDAPLDRLHPRKRARPIASGALSPRAGLAVAAVTAAAAIGLASRLGVATMVTVTSYLLVCGAYSLWLKHIAVLDIVAVAIGFVLRALAGAAANHLVVSNWFLLIALFGALYLVAGKRSAEAAGVNPDPDEFTTRPVLADYPAAWLQQVVNLALTGTVLSYAMWAFQYLGTDVFKPSLGASMIPFLIGMLRYGLLLAHGQGERPEGLLLQDRVIGAAALVWALMIAGSLYLA